MSFQRKWKCSRFFVNHIGRQILRAVPRRNSGRLGLRREGGGEEEESSRKIRSVFSLRLSSRLLPTNITKTVLRRTCKSIWPYVRPLLRKRMHIPGRNVCEPGGLYVSCFAVHLVHVQHLPKRRCRYSRQWLLCRHVLLLEQATEYFKEQVHPPEYPYCPCVFETFFGNDCYIFDQQQATVKDTLRGLKHPMIVLLLST